jgi:membrane-associated PAP2 superfamily phosphatase
MQQTIAVESEATERRRFWLWHVAVPLCCFVPLATLFAFSDSDRRISWAWAYDATLGGFPARHAFWAERLMHAYGRDFVWLIVICSAFTLALSAFRPALQVCRRPAVYVILAIGLTTGLIGGLKQLTHVHCPWDLQGFGGEVIYSTLFGSRELQSVRGVCFPGAHSGSGFALLALYFALRNYSTRWARRALWGALSIGCSFAFAQEARGAHFVSHDLWSAAIAWSVCLGLYVRLLAPASLRRSAPRPAAGVHPVAHPAAARPAAQPLRR